MHRWPVRRIWVVAAAAEGANCNATVCGDVVMTTSSSSQCSSIQSSRWAIESSLSVPTPHPHSTQLRPSPCTINKRSVSFSVHVNLCGSFELVAPSYTFFCHLVHGHATSVVETYIDIFVPCQDLLSSHPSQLVVTCGLQPRAIWIFHVQELLHLVLVFLQFLDLCAGTFHHQPWNHHPCIGVPNRRSKTLQQKNAVVQYNNPHLK